MRKTLFINLIIVSMFASVSTHADALIINRAQMKFASDSVEVNYKQKGYILAFIPITFQVTAIAHADGRVEVSYPWYSAITIDNRQEVETELKIAVETTLSAHLVGSVRAEGKSANPQFSASESVEVASAMHRVLQAEFNNVNSGLEGGQTVDKLGE